MQKIQVIVFHTGNNEGNKMVFKFCTGSLTTIILKFLFRQLGEDIRVLSDDDGHIFLSFPNSQKSYSQMKKIISRTLPTRIDREEVNVLPKMPDSSFFAKPEKHWSYEQQQRLLQQVG